MKSGTKFQAVVTNCETGKPEYPIIKDMFEDIEYVRASSSLPLLANMVEIDGKLYMDGGISDSIPLKQSIRQGNEKNVVVLTRPRDYRKKNSRAAVAAALKYRKYPKMAAALRSRTKTYNETLDFIAAEEAAGRAFVIAPMGPLSIGRTERDRNKLSRLPGRLLCGGRAGGKDERLPHGIAYHLRALHVSIKAFSGGLRDIYLDARWHTCYFSAPGRERRVPPGAVFFSSSST